MAQKSTGNTLESQVRLSESSAAPRRSAPPRRNVAQPQRSRSAAAAQPQSRLHCSLSAAAAQPQRSCTRKSLGRAWEKLGKVELRAVEDCAAGALRLRCRCAAAAFCYDASTIVWRIN
eukprot:gene15802-biopygen8816